MLLCGVVVTHSSPGQGGLVGAWTAVIRSPCWATAISVTLSCWPAPYPNRLRVAPVGFRRRRPLPPGLQQDQVEACGSQTPSSGAAFDYFPAGYSQSADGDRTSQVSLACRP